PLVPRGAVISPEPPAPQGRGPDGRSKGTRIPSRERPSVPASRSRTERWRDCLRQVCERDGALEISVPTSRPGPGEQTRSGFHGADLIWRVRIVSLTETEIVIEQ